MDDTLQPLRRRLSRAANIVILFNAALLILFLVQMRQLGSGYWRNALRDWQLISAVATIVVPGVLCLVMAAYIRRGAYGAVLTVTVITAIRLTRNLFSTAHWLMAFASAAQTVRLLLPSFIYLGLESCVLWMLIRTWPAMEEMPDSDAIRRARARAGVAMYVLTAALLCAGLGFIAACLMFVLSPSPRVGEIDPMVCLIVGVLMMLPVYGTLLQGVALRRGEAPARWGIALFAGLLLTLMLVDAFWYRGVLPQPLRTGPTFFLAWGLIDLLHGRRPAIGSPRQGFEPIIPQPVIPMAVPVFERTDDSASL